MQTSRSDARSTEQDAADDANREAIKLLGEVFGRRVSQEAQALWARALRSFPQPKLQAAFREATEWDHMPTLAEFKTHLMRAYTARAPEVPKRLTGAEKQRSDQSAVMAMLWLHYEHGWSFREFSGDILGVQFKAQTGRDAAQMLAEYSQLPECSRERVSRWMEQQQNEATR